MNQLKPLKNRLDNEARNDGSIWIDIVLGLALVWIVWLLTGV